MNFKMFLVDTSGDVCKKMCIIVYVYVCATYVRIFTYVLIKKGSLKPIYTALICLFLCPHNHLYMYIYKPGILPLDIEGDIDELIEKGSLNYIYITAIYVFKQSYCNICIFIYIYTCIYIGTSQESFL
jgi:hypothetical protein